jgi:hypothetical protein
MFDLLQVTGLGSTSYSFRLIIITLPDKKYYNVDGQSVAR